MTLDSSLLILAAVTLPLIAALVFWILEYKLSHKELAKVKME